MVEAEDKWQIKDNILIKYNGHDSKVVIPDGINIIGAGAFCFACLEEIIISDSVKEIREEAFKDCKNLKKVKLSNNLKKIESSAFAQSGIEEITVPDSVIEIGKFAFYCCQNLKNATLPNNLKKISECVFSYSSIEEITIPDSVTEIGEEAYSHCGSLKKVILPSNLNVIGYNAFRCSGLEEITIPSSVTKIEEGAFGECSNLKKITLLNDLKSIEYFTFILSDIEEVVLSGNVEKIEKNNLQQKHTIKRIYLPDGLKRIEESAFSFFSIEEIIIPDSVTEIEKEAFRYCRNLKKIVLPKGLKKISEKAFAKSGLEEIVVPDSVTEIEDYAFYACSNLKKVTLSSNLKNIGSSAFSECNLEEIVIPESVTKIEDDAFRECRNLKRISMPKELKKISKRSFIFSGLEEIIIPDSVTVIETSAFYGCQNLKRVILPKGIKEISERAFSYSGLEEIEFPESIIEIKDEAFSSCENLKTIKFSKSFPMLGYSVFEGCSNVIQATIPCAFTMKTKQNEFWLVSYNQIKKRLGFKEGTPISIDEPNEELIISEGITKIDDCAFKKCHNLKWVTLPKSLKCISSKAFSQCEMLEEIIIPDDVTEIRDCAFSDCLKLKRVRLPQNNSIFYKGSFCGCLKLEEIEAFDTLIYMGEVFNGCHITKLIIHGRVKDNLFNNLDISNLKEIHLFYNPDYTFKDLKCLKKWEINAKIIVHNCNLEDISYFTNLRWNLSNVCFEESDMPEIKPTKPKMSDDIEELLTKIKKITDLLNPQDCKEILTRVEKLVSDYKLAINDKRPKFTTKELFTFNLKKDYLTLKQELIIKLEIILFRLSKAPDYVNLIININKYLAYVTNRLEALDDSEISNQIKTIKLLARANNWDVIIISLTNILNDYKQKLSNFLVNDFTTKLYMPEKELSLEFSKSINDFLAKVKECQKKYVSFIYALDKKGDTDLGKDLNALNVVINSLDERAKEKYLGKTERLIKKYKDIINEKVKLYFGKDTIIDTYELEIELRKELMPILEELVEVVNMKDTTNEVDDCAKQLNEEGMTNGHLLSQELDNLMIFLEECQFEEIDRAEIKNEIAVLIQEWILRLNNNSIDEIIEEEKLSIDNPILTLSRKDLIIRILILKSFDCFKQHIITFKENLDKYKKTLIK